ncbi:imidazolonepropionase [Acidiphilium sp. AL]|uniref:Imidazolonepropionase n=2 Tax=Acidocellaceae TaxID=3385905 RepID=A0ABS9DV98_9PROT|nr:MULTISPECIES: imidazolonepropionase [Acidiphilium]MCF3946651.1 imidazolonepropionase [Acidiphilium iwatense]MCU4159976.1 imidazolonepropionase [Acidiphilium sp. AL]
MECDRLWTNARIATCAPGRAGLGMIGDGAIATANGRIVWCGSRAEQPAGLVAGDTIDCAGRLITPGLIDCHTHLIFAGDRSGEFARRLAGETYAEIARGGGGIVASMRATRAATEAELKNSAAKRLSAWKAEGVTTIEIKSGYGLDEATELRMLAAARALEAEAAMRVRATYLGAHAIPPDLTREAYLGLICDRMIPRIAEQSLADAVDGFCESIAFAPDEIARVFTAAQAHGLKVKLHADQLSDLGGAALAARFAALSADHLEYASASGIATMASANTIAVLLPGAYYVLRETRMPPVDAMRSTGCAIAIGSDCNPGTSPILSLRLSAHMACVFFGLTLEEAWLGITRNAAMALGVSAETGTIEAGKSCDLAIWDEDDPASVLGWIGPAPLHRRILKGFDA